MAQIVDPLAGIVADKQARALYAALGMMLRFVMDDTNPERAGYAFVSREGEWQARHPLLLVVKE